MIVIHTQSSFKKTPVIPFTSPKYGFNRFIFLFFIFQLRDSGCPFVTDKGQLRVQVEWEESYLLFQATYHKYDDVSRTHNYQMRYNYTNILNEEFIKN